MLVVVVVLLLVGAPAVALGAAGLGLWRRARHLGRTVGSAGTTVLEATDGLQGGLAQLQRQAPAADRAGGPGAAVPVPVAGDGARLAARVQGGGADRGGRPGPPAGPVRRTVGQPS